MKPLILILAMSAACFAQSLTSIGGNGGGGRGSSVEIGDFLWNGTYYLKARATVVSDGQAVKIHGHKGGDITIPWNKAPFSVTSKLATEREKLVVIGKAKAASEEQRAANEAAGLERIIGKILNRNNAGFLVSLLNSDLVVHVAGKIDLADGQQFDATLKRAGLHEYTTVLGAKATVKNYVQHEHVVIPTTPRKFDTTRIGEAASGGSSINATPPTLPQTKVRTVTHIVIGEPRQWKMTDGKSFIGKLIAFEDIVIEGTAAAPMNVPKKPTIVRNATARFYVNAKVYELALDKLGPEERKFIEDTSAAIAAKK